MNLHDATSSSQFLPDNKRRIVGQIQRAGFSVAMIGDDGINDALKYGNGFVVVE